MTKAQIKQKLTELQQQAKEISKLPAEQQQKKREQLQWELKQLTDQLAIIEMTELTYGTKI